MLSLGTNIVPTPDGSLEGHMKVGGRGGGRALATLDAVEAGDECAVGNVPFIEIWDNTSTCFGRGEMEIIGRRSGGIPGGGTHFKGLK